MLFLDRLKPYDAYSGYSDFFYSDFLRRHSYPKNSIFKYFVRQSNLLTVSVFRRRVDSSYSQFSNEMTRVQLRAMKIWE